MKTFIYYFSIAVFASFLCLACKKETTPSSNTTGSGEYIEFKIDGQLYRMEEQQNGSGFVIGGAKHTGPTSGKYALQIAFARSSQDEGATVMVLDNEPILKPHYTLNLLAFTSVVTYIKPDDTQYIISSNSVGNINFTSIDTTLNHSVEGTFDIDQLDLQDTDGNLISTGHTLTDGRFKTTIVP